MLKKAIQLSVPEPCTQDWQEMQPNAAGRHCMHCHKTVVDFRHFTDRELIAYFKEYKGPGCGRFMADQLDRTILSLNEPKRGWWMKMAAGLLLLLGIGKESSGQKIVHKQPQKHTVAKRKANKIHAPVKEDSVFVKGVLKDQFFNNLVNASVTIVDASTRQVIASGITDVAANFKIEIPLDCARENNLEAMFFYRNATSSMKIPPLMGQEYIWLEGSIEIGKTVYKIERMGGYMDRSDIQSLQIKAIRMERADIHDPYLQPKGIHRKVYYPE